MFVVSKAQSKKSRFIVRTDVKVHQLPNNNHQQPKPKLNSYFACVTPQNQGMTGHITKDIHMSQPFSNTAKVLIKKKLKFRFSIIKNCPQIKKHSRREKDSKTKYRRMTKDQNFACGRWKMDEHQRFVEAIIKHGNDWKEVQRCVKSRSCTQARSHAQKFFLKVRRAKLLKFNLDLSKSSIKMLHDYVSELSSEDYAKTLQALNNVAFEKNSEKRGQSRGKSTNMIDSSEQSNDDMSDNNDDVLYTLDQPISFTTCSIDPYSHTTKARTMSIDIEDQIPLPNRMHRGSINSFDGFYNNMIDDKEKEFHFEPINEKEYLNTFNNAFKTIRIEHSLINQNNDLFTFPRSRKVSVEDDFLYNYVMKP